jgi:hypothetical protein
VWPEDRVICGRLVLGTELDAGRYMGDRPAVESFPDLGLEGVVRGVLVGEERFAAVGRDRHRVEGGVDRRALDVARVHVERAAWSDGPSDVADDVEVGKARGGVRESV